MKILLVEDDRRIGRFIEKGLRENAYAVVWKRLLSEAEEALCVGNFDLLILDLGMPDGDGIDFLEARRKAGLAVSTLILSARDSVADRVAGLNLGADDYLTKPFSFEEFLARVRALLRRQGTVHQTVLAHRGVQMDLLSRSVTCDGRIVELTNREFALLELFLSNAGRTLTRTFIGEKVWESSYGVQTNLIDVYIRKLRTHLGDHDRERPLIRTVRGVGYVMQ
jgi:DNA-binding response OmpR family regulator